MTASPRPNLGGLFNGSTPPGRSSTIAEALGPRGVRLTAVVDEADSANAAADAAADSAPAAPQADATGQESVPAQDGGPTPEFHWPAPNWLNPVTAVEHYFAFLHTLLDANQRFAMSLAGTLVSLPQRVNPWR